LKNVFPNQLIQRPARPDAKPLDVRVGDRVTLLPADGGPPVTATVKLAVPLFGCTTYTTDPVVAAVRRGSPERMATRYRFRWQDVHHLEPARHIQKNRPEAAFP